MKPWHLVLVIGCLMVPLSAWADVGKTAGTVDITKPIGTPATTNAAITITTSTLTYSGMT